MKPVTIELHTALIRLMKGIISAWSNWLEKVKLES